MRNIGILVAAVVLLFLLNTAHTTVWYVHPDSTLNAIQVGIGLCSTGDTVLVGPGTYIENINFNGMAITVTSEYDADTTIIDGSNPTNPDSGSAVIFNSGEDSSSVLEGFTITNGTGTINPGYGYWGGGIYCLTSSPTIVGNRIENNTATYGGGIACYINAQALIDSNTITANTADSSGAGILASDSRPIISNNAITLNNSPWCAGIYVCWDCDPTITNNTIDGNYAAEGGAGIGIYLYASPTVENNIITANIGSNYGSGVYCGGDCTPQFRGNTIANNGQWGIYSVLGAISTFKLCNISNNADGVFCYDCSITFDSCTISSNQAIGIHCEADVDAVINWCNIYGHTAYGVSNSDPSDTVNAENDWWGDPSGPGGFGPGTGDSVSNYVDYDPWLTDSVEWVGIAEHEPSQPITTLLQISPNPFRDRVNITFSIGQSAKSIELKIYDATGRLVKTLSVPSSYSLVPSVISWNGVDDANRKLPSGVYFLNVSAGDYQETKKLLLIR